MSETKYCYGKECQKQSDVMVKKISISLKIDENKGKQNRGIRIKKMINK